MENALHFSFRLPLQSSSFESISVKWLEVILWRRDLVNSLKLRFRYANLIHSLAQLMPYSFLEIVLIFIDPAVSSVSIFSYKDQMHWRKSQRKSIRSPTVSCTQKHTQNDMSGVHSLSQLQTVQLWLHPINNFYRTKTCDTEHELISW